MQRTWPIRTKSFHRANNISFRHSHSAMALTARFQNSIPRAFRRVCFQRKRQAIRFARRLTIPSSTHRTKSAQAPNTLCIRSRRRTSTRRNSLGRSSGRGNGSFVHRWRYAPRSLLLYLISVVEVEMNSSYWMGRKKHN